MKLGDFLLCLHIVGEQDCLRYCSHRLATVHARLADLTKGLLLGKALLDEKTLGTLNDLAAFQLFGEARYLLLQGS